MDGGVMSRVLSGVANLSAAASSARTTGRTCTRSRTGSAHFRVAVFIARPIGQGGRARRCFRARRGCGGVQVALDRFIDRLSGGRLQDIARQRQIEGAGLRGLRVRRAPLGPPWQSEGQQAGQQNQVQS